jgi:hypothetical protein
LKTVTLSEALQSVEEATFADCRQLETITLFEGIVSIAKNAFIRCNKLESVTLPKGLTVIGESAFEDCSELKVVTFPETLQAIGEDAFNQCIQLGRIHLPKGLLTIGNYAFCSCKELRTVTISGVLTHIGQNIFLRCNKLNIVSCPAELVVLDAFQKVLMSISMANSVDTRGQNLLHTIIVNSEVSNAILEKISDSLKKKIISKDLGEKMSKIRENELSRLQHMPGDALYNLLSMNRPGTYPLIPDDLFPGINHYLNETHRRNAENCMLDISWSQTLLQEDAEQWFQVKMLPQEDAEQWYQAKMHQIVNEEIKKIPGYAPPITSSKKQMLKWETNNLSLFFAETVQKILDENNLSNLAKVPEKDSASMSSLG